MTKPKIEETEGASLSPVNIQPVTVTVESGEEVSAELAELFLRDSGKDNVSDKQEDMIVPLVYVLQSNSPQVDPQGPDYVKGAVPGCIWFRGTSMVIPGNEGILFQMVYWFKNFVEWVPRSKGGGWVGVHAEMPADAKETPDPERPTRMRWMLPNGNEIVETRYHVGFAQLPNGRIMPYMIPMSSTGNTVSRNWTTMINNDYINGKRIPAWARLYRLVTKRRKNAAGTWYTWDVVPQEGFVQIEAYNRGATLNSTAAELVIDTTEHLEDQQRAGGGGSDGGPKGDAF